MINLACIDNILIINMLVYFTTPQLTNYSCDQLLCINASINNYYYD